MYLMKIVEYVNVDQNRENRQNFNGTKQKSRVFDILLLFCFVFFFVCFLFFACCNELINTLHSIFIGKYCLPLTNVFICWNIGRCVAINRNKIMLKNALKMINRFILILVTNSEEHINKKKIEIQFIGLVCKQFKEINLQSVHFHIIWINEKEKRLN